MAAGPGKYDDVCTMAAQQAGMNPDNGATVLIVINGNKGSGFSAQVSHPALMKIVPDMLETVAKEMRQDMANVIAQMKFKPR
jgi:hypothetical protein